MKTKSPEAFKPKQQEVIHRKGNQPAPPGTYTQKKKEAYKSIPKAKRIDSRYGERKAAGTGKRLNVKTRTSRTRSKNG